MEEISHIITIIVSIITGLGVIGGIVFAVYRWYLRQNNQDTEIEEIKQSQSLIIKSVLACLKGLQEQGCNGSVTKQIQAIEDYLVEKANK